MLGIPTVLDRFIQQLLLQVMTPIWEPRFSEHSYGFRPGRKAAFAVRAAQRYVEKGQDWVVDLDITKFFDHVNWDILMEKVGAVIRDKRVLKLIGKYLRAGAMADGVVVKSVEGTPQGGPLSPLLANIYLDALDRELERRKHSFCRYADDCNIYVGSRRAAGTGEGVDTGMDRKATAATVECHQERGREDLGTEVSGIPTEPPATDRSGTGESGTVQNEGTGEVAELPESDE